MRSNQQTMERKTYVSTVMLGLSPAYWNLPSVQEHRNLVDRWMSSDANQGAEPPLACTGLFDRDRLLAGSQIREEQPLSGAAQL